MRQAARLTEYPLYLWIPVHPKSYNGHPVCGDGEVRASEDEPMEHETYCSHGGRYVLYKRAKP